MHIKNQTKALPEKEKGSTEDLELLNKKRKLQNKVLQKLVENLNKEIKEVSKIKKGK